MEVYIYYNCTYEDIEKINKRFGFPHCVTVNGETCKPVEVKPEDWPLLEETARRGYIQIRKKPSKQQDYEKGTENQKG